MGKEYATVFACDIPVLERFLRTARESGKVKSRDWTLNSIADDLRRAKRLVSACIDTEAKFNAAREVAKDMQGGPSAKVLAEQRKRKLEAGLIGQKIPGFFPTPKLVIRQMIDKADIREGMKVLEPSAGKGDIIEGINEAYPGISVDAIELCGTLREILEVKGYELIGDDFLEHYGQYDRIVMNPPFENGTDIIHIRHAYELLKPEGRVVSIMSEGPFFRNDKAAVGFREWLGDVGGKSEKMVAGLFTGKDAFRQTGIASRIVTIDKPTEKK